MSEAVPMNDLAIADLEVSEISDIDLEDAFRRVILTHKEAVASIHQSMKDADDAYRKYLDPDYIPLEEIAKVDRATLNKAEKNIAEKYADLKEAYEKPLANIEANIKEIRRVIKNASGTVDLAVQKFEEKRKAKKREEIRAYFNAKGFALVTLDKIFDDKWLNKTKAMSEVREELDEKIAVIYRDIEILEKIPEHGMAAKAFYLDKLDMGAALRQVEIIKENAAKLAREQASREERQTQETVAGNAAAERQEKLGALRVARVSDMIDQALDLPQGTVAEQEKAEAIEFTLQFRGTREQLLKLKEYMTAQGIPYQKIMILENDRDAAVYMRQKNIPGRIWSAVILPKEVA